MSSPSKVASTGEPLARLLGVRKPLDARARFWVGVLAFALPFSSCCAVSYVPFIWHPQVLVSNAGNVNVPGEYSYVAQGDTIDLDVFVMRNRELSAAHASLAEGKRVNPIYLQAPHEVARAIKTMSVKTPVILLTGWGRRMSGSESDMPANVDRTLDKPPKLVELREALAGTLAMAGQ